MIYNNWPLENHPDNCKAYCLDKIEINASIDVVWSWLEKPGLYPLWYKLWPKVEMKGGQDKVLEKDSSFVATPKGIRSPTFVVDLLPKNTIAWTGKRFGVRGYHSWILEERNGITSVVTEETFSGLLPNFLPKPFMKSAHEMHRHWLSQLKKVSEKGAIHDFKKSEIKALAYSD